MVNNKLKYILRNITSLFTIEYQGVNYLIVNNVKCLNGVNTYPNFKWLNIVDPEGTFNEVYNRFAHISIQLGNKTDFRLLAADAYVAELTYENIKAVGAKYYFALSKISEETIQKFHLEEKYINTEKSQYIYMIK